MPGTQAIVFVDYQAFVRMVSTGGEANKHVVNRMNMMLAAAIAEAPVGAPRIGEAHGIGNLKYSHRKTGTQKRGPLRAVGTIYNTADYAEVVHNGGPSITPSPKFVIPKSSWLYYTGGRMGGHLAKKSPRGTHITWANRVRGQSGNDWLDRACTRVARLDA